MQAEGSLLAGIFVSSGAIKCKIEAELGASCSRLRIQPTQETGGESSRQLSKVTKLTPLDQRVH